MKTKILITAIITLAAAPLAVSSEASGQPGDAVYSPGSQQTFVSNYYSSYGYEYSSRLRRFHNSYVTFDFYSPVYTEVYWYNYTPGAWGVSIYDPWYGYSAYAPSYYTGSGFGGSYWWGYNSWSSYGWNSWVAPAPGLSINIHFGNNSPYYPAYYNRWYSGSYMNCCCPGGSTGNNYYPSQPYSGGSTPRFIVTGGRSSGSQSTTTSGNSGNTQGTATGGTQGRDGNTGGQGNNGNQGNSGNQGNNAGQGGNDKDKSNNGLRMGQYRRGVAEPTAPKPNEPARTNNPNVNDRTNPGRDKSNNAKPKESGTASPEGSVTRQQTQSSVKTSRRSPAESSEIKSSGDENSQKKSSSSGRRL
jgi:hypothetical protein